MRTIFHVHTFLHGLWMQVHTDIKPECVYSEVVQMTTFEEFGWAAFFIDGHSAYLKCTT